jgi:D-serine deaminase-like pyridoxal phosphate-dependent protein
VSLLELPTPCLILDVSAMHRNVGAMMRALRPHRVALRQHVKTAKSVEVAGQIAEIFDSRAITVSTLAEAEAFVEAGFDDVLYAVGLVPQKVGRLCALAESADVAGIVDSVEVLAAIAAEVTCERPLPLGIEIDVGQHRGGTGPESDLLLAIAEGIASQPRLRLWGVVAHAGHAYDAADRAGIIAVAEAERKGAVRAAERLRAAGHVALHVSIGSTPTALFGASFEGITEVRAGVFVFQDLFQSALGCAAKEDIAVSVLTAVIGIRGDDLLLDAGGIALSKDRSMDGRGGGYGELRTLDGGPIEGAPRVHSVNQEHGMASVPGHRLKVGDRLRVLPNHVCMTAAQHDHYWALTGDGTATQWPRIRGY